MFGESEKDALAEKGAEMIRACVRALAAGTVTSAVEEWFAVGLVDAES